MVVLITPLTARPYSAPNPALSIRVSLTALIGMAKRSSPPRRVMLVSTPSMKPAVSEMVPPFIAGAMSSSGTAPVPAMLMTPGSILTVEAYIRDRKGRFSATSLSSDEVAPISYLLTSGASESTVISSPLAGASRRSTPQRTPPSTTTVCSAEPRPSSLASSW